MLQEACEEYLAYIKEEKLEDEIRAVPLEILREFLVKDVEYRAIKNSDFKSFGTSQN
jgi:hypothetical protein